VHPILLMALLQAPTSPAPQKPDTLALARQYTAWFYTGQVDSLLAHYASGGRDSTQRQQLTARMEQVAVRAGTEMAVIEEKFVKRNGATQYWRTAKFSDMSEPFLLRWVITPDGKIGGLGLGPLSQAPPIDP